MDQPQLVSVGICTRNRGASIVATVQSILANTYVNFELIIADQSTRDETFEALTVLPHDPRIRLIRSHERGIARSRNVLLAQAKADLLLMTDDDCVVPSDWIAQMISLFARYPTAAMAFCRVIAPPELLITNGIIPVFLCANERILRSTRAFDQCGIGAGMGMRRNLIRTIGGFDPYLGTGSTFNSGEETDMQLRILVRGHSIVVSPATTVVHYGLRTAEQMRCLLKRDSLGLGVVLGKMLQYATRSSLLALARFTGNLLWDLGQQARRGKQPQGLRRLLWLYQGIFVSWNAPIDKQKLVFQLSPQQIKKLSFLIVDA